MLYLAAFGMLCPLVSWLTAAIGAYQSRRDGRNHSAILIPIIGPVCLTTWIVLADWPYWSIPIVWIADLGTMALVVAAPRMYCDWWRTSRFTLVRTLRGNRDIESAILTIHSGGHYFLEKSWQRPQGTYGIVELGETGTYLEMDGGYELTSHIGMRRLLHPSADRTGATTFFVSEPSPTEGELQSYALDGWILSENLL